VVGQAAAIGLTLTALVAAVFGLVSGRTAAVAAGSFGALATVLHAAAMAIAKPSLAAGDYRGLLGRWGAGTLLRLLGIVLIPVAVAVDRSWFAPLPVALGYVGVLFPLFLLEVRRFR